MIAIDFSIEEQGKGRTKYDVGSDLSGTKSLEELFVFFKRNLILVADIALKEEQLKGFDKNPIISVDNRVGKPISEVKPFGKIEMSRRQQVDVLLPEIYLAIQQRSPVDSGLYRETNLVFLNGKVIASNLTEMDAWAKKKIPLKEGDVIRFMNAMPYAGKLEREGVTADRSVKRLGKARDKRQRSGPMVRMPNGTYFLSYRAAQKKFKLNANIKFEWINGASLDLSGVRNTSKSGKPLRKTFHPSSGRKGSYVYPSIVVRIREGGLSQ